MTIALKIQRAILLLLSWTASLASASAQCELHKLEPADNQGGDWLGWSVDLWGDTAVLGAFRDFNGALGTGSAYVYERRPAGWVETQKLLAWDGGGAQDFGQSVAIWGDTILVGANWDDDNGPYSGSVYAFQRTPAGWIGTQKLLPGDGRAHAQFGGRVALCGDTAVVVASRRRHAYVFERGPLGWVETARVRPLDQNSPLGSVALGDDVLFLGAPTSDTPVFQAGWVYCFERTPAGWQQTQRLAADDPGFQSHFGNDISIDGDRALIGAEWDDNPPGSGAAYVFERGLTGWTQTAKLVDATGQYDDSFGQSVALSGRFALIGAPYAELGSDTVGAVLLFEETSSGWAPIRKLHAGDAQHKERFGISVAMQGGTAIVGDFADWDPAINSGAGYVLSVPEFASTFCFCGASGPCGNGAPLGSCINSTGAGARLNACGTASVAADDLLLQLSGAPPARMALLYCGPGRTRTPFGDGFGCVADGGLGILRFPARLTSAAGTSSEGPGLLATLRATHGSKGQILAGQTWQFQAWFHDPAGPCGGGLNLSNALSISFWP